MFYIQHESKQLGSDNAAFIEDLKTFRGIKKRLTNPKAFWKQGKWLVYSFGPNQKYDEKSYKFVGEIVVDRSKK